jgi:hypothetical protein
MLDSGASRSVAVPTVAEDAVHAEHHDQHGAQAVGRLEGPKLRKEEADARRSGTRFCSAMSARTCDRQPTHKHTDRPQDDLVHELERPARRRQRTRQPSGICTHVRRPLPRDRRCRKYTISAVLYVSPCTLVSRPPAARVHPQMKTHDDAEEDGRDRERVVVLAEAEEAADAPQDPDRGDHARARGGDGPPRRGEPELPAREDVHAVREEGLCSRSVRATPRHAPRGVPARRSWGGPGRRARWRSSRARSDMLACSRSW